MLADLQRRRRIKSLEENAEEKYEDGIL